MCRRSACAVGRVGVGPPFPVGGGFGVGGTGFRVAIRYIGFSGTYATAIGISTVVGTAYAIAKGKSGLAQAAANLAEFWAKTGSVWVVAGIAVGVVGVVYCGISGRWKERDQAGPGGDAGASRALAGVVPCFGAGLPSAVYGHRLAEC